MGRRRGVAAVLAAAALALIAGAAVGGRARSAQEMGASPQPMMAHDAYPAHIHAGTCAALGAVVHPLNDAVSPGEAGAMAGTPGAAVASPPADLGEVVAQSITRFAAALDTIAAGGHAVNVHESAQRIQVYIACGDIVGPAVDGRLRIELAELNHSGYRGQALLEDNGDGTTTVTVWLVRTGPGTMGGMGAMDGMSTPMASPAS